MKLLILHFLAANFPCPVLLSFHFHYIKAILCFDFKRPESVCPYEARHFPGGPNRQCSTRMTNLVFCTRCVVCFFSFSEIVGSLELQNTEILIFDEDHSESSSVTVNVSGDGVEKKYVKLNREQLADVP